MVERSSLELAACCFVTATGLLAWRLWVGVKPKGRWLILWIFAATFMLQMASVLVLGIDDVTGALYGGAAAYIACLLVTRGRPERMLEVWKVTGEAPPSSGERRSVTLHQLAFCTLMVGAGLVYFWVVGDLR